MAVFEARTTLRCVIDAAFDFLIRPDNVELLSHPDVGLEYIVAPDVIELGTRLKFKVEGYGVTQQIVHEIIAFERPTYFTEKQTTGPLGLWVHEHRLETGGDGEVTLIDRVEFKPPGGLIGFIATESRIMKSLEEGFAHQHRELRKHLDAAT
jgi:ligand-binding SRPBCC domain-containing protein